MPTWGSGSNLWSPTVVTHPKAATDQPDMAARQGAAVRLMQAVYFTGFGATVGALIGSIWGLEFFGCVTGLILGFAGRTAWVLFAQPTPPDEYAQGNADTEEEVRQALADIKANRT